ncbi:MAG: glutamine-hydrolyzing carbamoyl-phosphate synthase small subunit [Actinobacteria bacterium]|nr:glutamine-hydrolyzing carbamoyl-phosphate synthase small subunit [Actinomycetota bacterium]
MEKRIKAIIALEDGYFDEGYACGAEGETAGELIFNTSMTGYQEVFTDPSYAGQIVIMTYPQIGNYGINYEDEESDGPKTAGVVVRELSDYPSNWRSEDSLRNYLKKHGIVAIEGVDTRELVRRIRDKGAMNAVISTVDLNPKNLVEKARNFPKMEGLDLVAEVTTDKPYLFSSEGDFKVAVLDGGVKRSILELLARENLIVEVLPAKTPAEEILANGYDGFFISNGPGDPAALDYMIETTRKILGKIPVFGICLGHQIIALASGLRTEKMKFGHHGSNQPVKNLKTGRIEIASENHGFAVSRKSLKLKPFKYIPGEASKIRSEIGTTEFGDVELTFMNLNDGTIEGFSFLEIPCFCVQFHPEASPGPHDTRYLFSEFRKMIEGGR